jgi:hydroxymethylpyrimidine pyrophosphatase-like HAD family hydrolase
MAMIFFDLDGTLLDYNNAEYQAVQALYAEHFKKAS